MNVYFPSWWVDIGKILAFLQERELLWKGKLDETQFLEAGPPHYRWVFVKTT